MPEYKTKRLTYWRASMLQGRSTLQAALTNALKNKQSIGVRKEPAGMDDGDTLYRFINYHPAFKGMQFGELVQYEQGLHHEALAIDEAKDAVDITAVAPPNEDEEFLGGNLFFGSLDNHLILLQSKEVQARQLENHLNWLLSEAGAIQPDDGVGLIKEINPQVKEQIVNKNATKLKIGTPLFDEKRNVDEIPKQKGERKQRYFVALNGKGWDILNVLSEDSLRDIALNDSVDPESIEVLVEIRLKRRSNTENSKVMEQLTKSLRHSDPNDVKIDLKGTGELKGDELYLWSRKGIQCANGIPDRTDIFNSIADWMHELLDNGLV